MDTSKIEERLADLESKSCCGRVKFYSASSPKPTTGIKKVLYIDEDTGDMFIWDGSGYVAL